MKYLFVTLTILALVSTSVLFNSCGSNPTSPAPTATPVPPTATSTPTGTPTASPTATLPYSQAATLWSGSFTNPYAIRYDGAGNLWVSDIGANTLSKWATNGTSPITTITSFNGSKTFNGPYGDSIDPSTGNVYVANEGNYEIDVFDGSGNYLTSFGQSQIGSTGRIYGVGVNSTGTTVYLADQWSNSVYIYTITVGTPPTYSYVTSFGSSDLSFPANFAFDSSNNVYVADKGNGRIVEYDHGGTYQGAVTLLSSASPSDVAVDGSGNIYALYPYGGLIEKFNHSGTWQASYGSGLLHSGTSQLFGFTMDGVGNFYVTSYANTCVVELKK